MHFDHSKKIKIDSISEFRKKVENATQDLSSFGGSFRGRKWKIEGLGAFKTSELFDAIHKKYRDTVPLIISQDVNIDGTLRPTLRLYGELSKEMEVLKEYHETLSLLLEKHETARKEEKQLSLLNRIILYIFHTPLSSFDLDLYKIKINSILKPINEHNEEKKRQQEKLLNDLMRIEENKLI